VRRLTRGIEDRMRLGDAVLELHRDEDGVRLRTTRGWWPQRFDQVVLATHADRSLSLLGDPTPDERRLLGASATAATSPCCIATPR
jgi:predicted NAD/FAD-binding protein